MSKTDAAPRCDETLEIELRDPGWAALLAWLWPGAGHLYQRRHAKGVLFMVCILTLYFFGLALGDGHVVYASWTKEDRRWHYFCQLGVGLPALPAVGQAYLVNQKHVPPLCGGLMAPPRRPPVNDGDDELAQWHNSLGSKFELGTLYTMIAGLLNILAIYDAFGGPFVMTPEKTAKKSETPPAGPS
jgi:hypothetical protein